MIRQIFFLILAMMLAGVFAYACNSGDDDDDEAGDDDDDTADDDDASGDDDDDDDDTTPPDPTWDNFALEFMTTYCTNCHGDPPTQGAPYALETYDQVVYHISKVYQRTILLEDMPPSAPLPSQAERARFDQWVQDEAPEN